MSYLGSPYSNSYYQDYDDDRYLDEEEEEDHEKDEIMDESDEDTEDASETDTGGRHEEPLEIKEQMYQDKLATLKKKMQQLKEGTHYDYNKKVKKLEIEYRERLRINALYKDYVLSTIERDYVLEIKAADREYEDKKCDLKENIISDLEDKKRNVEAERFSMDLTGDSMEVKPVMTRKLRRRPNDPIPVPEKRRKAPSASITYLLDDKEVESDLKLINRGKIMSPAVRKHSENSSCLSPSHIAPAVASFNDLPINETKVEDGKLLYEKRWFHRGQSVFVEGRDVAKFPANISAITNEVIWVKKNDGSKFRIYISHLARGKYSIKRRAA